jgi:hypothetical protein
MSYQFAHLETYSRKANKQGVNTRFVFDEVTRRDPEACRHVENPTPPTLVYGMSVEDLEALHDKMCEETKTTNAKGQTRAIRKDQHTLMTVVLSYPGQPEPGIASYDEWKRRSVDWLKKKYGDDLKTVVEHTDEANPHLHAYILPGNARAKDMNPGYVAKRAAEAEAKEAGKDAKAAVKDGNRAYRSAMREWQDSFFEEVGRPCGLTRIGPARRRLTREQHTMEKDAVKRARAAELLIEEAARRDRLSRERERRIQQKEAILKEEVGSGWFARQAKAKRLAELTADSIMEKVREEGRQEGFDSAKPSFDRLKKLGTKKISSLEEENARLKTQNAALLIETSKPPDYELSLDIAESTLRDLVDLQHEKALETGESNAYRDLSGTCEKAALFGRRTDRDSIIDHVKGVVMDVRDRAKDAFRRFFGWATERPEDGSPPLAAPAPPAPSAPGRQAGQGRGGARNGQAEGMGVGLGDPGKKDPRPF